MRRFRLMAAFLLLLPALPGCDEKGSSSSSEKGSGGGLAASAPPAYEPPTTWSYAPAPDAGPRTDGAALRDAVGAASPTGKDTGRAVFDGDTRVPGSADGPKPGAVPGKAGSPGGTDKASYTAGARRDTLAIAEPPAPVQGPGAGGERKGEGGAGALLASSDGSGPDKAVIGADGSCPADMVGFSGFCVDRYEYPNRAGAAPLAAKTALEGEALCAAAGKRLCTEDEWEAACSGGSRTLPYAGRYEKGRCNDDKTWRLVTDDDWRKFNGGAQSGQAHAAAFYQAEPSGSRALCSTPEGVFDLMGNAAEWTTARGGRRYKHVMKGGYWSGKWNFGGQWSCGLTNTGHPGSFRSYEAGFRCCMARPS